MTDELRHDLSNYRLADHEHASGCPADPLRQESFATKRPPQRGLVQSGVSDSGEPVYTEGQRDGEKVVIARCMDCGAQRLFEMGERDE